MTPDASVSAPVHTRLPVDTRDGPVTLAVADRDGLVAWYGRVLGFVELARSATRSVLGAAGGAALLVLDQKPGLPAHDQRTAGLFHVAYLVPSREDLARWVAHVAAQRIPIEGASDHLVSEAFYLSDPEGNGIEVYRDRPRGEWRRKGDEIEMDTLAADVQGLLALGTRLPAWTGAASGTTVGHVHLKVADLDAARRFYVETLGMDLMTTYPGALFVAAGGYHHHFGLNVWRSKGRPKPAREEYGLAETTIVVPDAAALAATAARLATAGYRADSGDGAVITVDPAGNRLRLAIGEATAEALLAA